MSATAPSPLRIRFPDELPISARIDELKATLERHQVVVVAGETGSGKSTQLPKLCLDLGRGAEGKLIGHTQPRRVAARSVAARVAEELDVKLGSEVGYSVRFDDRVDASTRLRVMTDGVLLAELQRDRELSRYDTIIIDEAHERSLNIDFLLGYLRQLLPRRPDLKVIVTSATIDTARFARHFADANGDDAPIVEVTGRTYPVEVRYRSFGAAAERDEDDDGDATDASDASDASAPRYHRGAGRRRADPAERPERRTARDDRDQVQAVLDAVDELLVEGPGDILVFLSGEREIHDTADALRARDLPDTEILPLYARLSAAEQHRIFAPHPGRRIVVSTNVAETSITVPGVRYVIDTGTARISRYSKRLKVQRLPIEPISQASANQRAGRCGRVAPGICIRLFDEEEFATRPEFTEPEILRTNLASVILQMAAIGLGDVAAFPFVEPPERSAIRDGELLLDELGAIRTASTTPSASPSDRSDDRADGVTRLTKLGRRLARLPVDPRLGRMVLEAERLDCVREVLVIASALSIRDPRERPEEHREKANELHNRFKVPNSDLLSIVALWDHLRAEQRQRSGNQFRRMCRDEFVNYVRVREWQDLYSQLRRVAGELGVRPRTDAAHPDHIHRAVLAGHLSHLGNRHGESREYRGARGSTFVIAPGSACTRSLPRWVMAAELVETDRLRARRVAAVQPEWAEQLAPHLVKRSYSDPWWDEQRGAAVTHETVTLFGMPIVQRRTVMYDRVDAEVARDMFVRHALVQGEWRTRHRFVKRNAAFRDRVSDLEDRVRRGDLLDDETLFAHYDALVPDDVTTARRFDRWWDRTRTDQPDLLDLTEESLTRAAGYRAGDFPDEWPVVDAAGNVRSSLRLGYRFDPSSPLDGVTVHVPITVLNQVTGEGFDWHVPRHRAELVDALVRTLPKQIRRELIPAAETIDAAIGHLPGDWPPRGLLVDALAIALQEVTAANGVRDGRGVPVSGDDFDRAALAPHLRVTYVVAADDGTVLDAGKDLAALRARLASEVRSAVAAAAPVQERRGITEWDLGAMQREIVTTVGGNEVRGYPALLDDDTSVSLRVLTSADLQARVMRGGVRRLLLLGPAPSPPKLLRGIGNTERLAVAGTGFELADLAADAAEAAVDRVLADHALPWDEEAYRRIARDVRDRAPQIAADALSSAIGIVALAAGVQERLSRMRAVSLVDTAEDARRHLERLVRPRFVTIAGTRRLPDVARYVRGIEYRLERLEGDLARDHRRMDEVVPLERRYATFLRGLHAARRPVPAEAVEVGWQLEEWRVAVFAQALGVSGSVSAKKLRRALDALEAAAPAAR